MSRRRPIPAPAVRALLRADDSGADDAGTGHPGGWWSFTSPRAVLEATSPAEVPGVLAEAEAGLARGLWAVGFVAYEASPAFDPAFAVHRPAVGVPCAWIGLFDPPGPSSGPPAPRTSIGGGSGPAPDLDPDLDHAAHGAAVAAIHRAIARGDTYQANLTYRLTARLERCSPDQLFAALLASQETPYATLLDLGDGRALVSASPELFFERRGERVLCRPMKGTAPRGASETEDAARAAALETSAKERAENLMIVDMVRNDLGRIARPGSVRVPRLFEIHRYPTLFQMTSDVEARVDLSVGLAELFAALFPCASITGAPKIATMELLRRLEPTPRGVYTGAVGWAAPDGRCRFAVAIRTAWLDRDRLTYGTGSGIVWDSAADAEWRETRTKAVVLERALKRLAPTSHDDPPSASQPSDDGFRLFETLLWHPERWSRSHGYRLLERHLGRLEAAAAHFGWPFDRARVETRLIEQSRRLAPGPHRIRLLLDPEGGLEIESLALDGGNIRPRYPWRLALATEPVDPDDPFIRFKTTRRDVYERAAASRPEADDVILWSDGRDGSDGPELTETTIANLVLRLDGRCLTPRAEAGLLPGTLRATLLDRGRIEEARLTPADLDRAEAVFLINSVRGVWRATVDRTIDRTEADPRRKPAPPNRTPTARRGGEIDSSVTPGNQEQSTRPAG